MPEELEIIAATHTPATVKSLARDLIALGVQPGVTLLVHSSLSALGYVAGGAQAVVLALMEAVGPGGTIVMPTQSGQLTDPGDWSNPPVPDDWIKTLRAETPAYDMHLTPTREMGQIVECFRQHRGTLRSNHPTVSFAALGPDAESIIRDHPLTPSLGEPSPLGRLYEQDASVLLLGVGHANNTSLHLAEYRASWPDKANHREGAPILVNGQRRWVRYEDLDVDESDFDQIGDAFAATEYEKIGPVGAGIGRLCKQRSIVDFGVAWITDNRTAS